MKEQFQQDALEALRVKAGRLREDGRYREAEQSYREALAFIEKHEVQDEIEWAITANDLGVLYKYMAHFDEAARLYEQALAIFRRVYGDKHPDIATIYHNLGGLEHARGRPGRYLAEW